SPGINDPFTAMTCLDRLGSALYRLASRDLPGDRRIDDDGLLRLVMPAFSFEETVHTAFTQIRQNARGSSAVHARLLETMASVAAVACRADDRDVIGRHAARVMRAATLEVAESDDRRWLQRLHAEVQAALRRAAQEAEATTTKTEIGTRMRTNTASDGSPGAEVEANSETGIEHATG
ncbi:MAG: DUF2254 family protein, partial [Rubrivivax sp.]